MAAYPQRASLCHLAPCRIQGKQIVCAFCNEACNFAPDFGLEQTNTELTLRRYKEGDLTFIEAYDSLQEIAKRQYVETIDNISRAKWPRNI